MKTIRLKAARGFTLIELLVVISIIAILAGLLLSAMPGIRVNAMKKRARAELQQVALAIDDYKAKLGYYPPDNRNNYGLNTLFYELVGCTRSAGAPPSFTPLDGSPVVSIITLNSAGNMGVMNATSGNSDSDEGRVAYNFLKELKSTQYADAAGLRRLGMAFEGPAMVGSITPYFYNSSNPTNNPNSYDLWVDVVIGGKTNRISNWTRP